MCLISHGIDVNRCLRLATYGLQPEITRPPFKVIFSLFTFAGLPSDMEGVCVHCCISLPDTWATNGEEQAGCGRDLDFDFICHLKTDAGPYICATYRLNGSWG